MGRTTEFRDVGKWVNELVDVSFKNADRKIMTYWVHKETNDLFVLYASDGKRGGVLINSVSVGEVSGVVENLSERFADVKVNLDDGREIFFDDPSVMDDVYSYLESNQ